MKCEIHDDGALELTAETQEDADRIFEFHSEFIQGCGELVVAIPTEYMKKEFIYGAGSDLKLDS